MDFMDDFELLRQFHGGSEDAFQMLVNRHLNVVYSVALRTVRSPQFAEEIEEAVESLRQAEFRKGLRGRRASVG